MSATKGQDRRLPTFIRGNFFPVHPENDEVGVQAKRLEVTFGSIPAGLVGCYVRNGPNPFFQLEKTREGKWQPYHFFDGDGFLHQITICSDKPPEYCGNWVKTTRFQANKAKGSAVHPVGESFAGNTGPTMDSIYPEWPQYMVCHLASLTAFVSISASVRLCLPLPLYLYFALSYFYVCVCVCVCMR